jgi:hypothetical protein
VSLSFSFLFRFADIFCALFLQSTALAALILRSWAFLWI